MLTISMYTAVMKSVFLCRTVVLWLESMYAYRVTIGTLFLGKCFNDSLTSEFYLQWAVLGQIAEKD